MYKREECRRFSYGIRLREERWTHDGRHAGFLLGKVGKRPAGMNDFNDMLFVSIPL